MKLFRTLALAIAIVVAHGCASQAPGAPALTTAQQAIASATTSYQALDAAIVATDAAVKSGTLKGQDARNALKGLTDAKAGLDVGLVALRAANAAAAAPSPASGVMP